MQEMINNFLTQMATLANGDSTMGTGLMMIATYVVAMILKYVPEPIRKGIAKSIFIKMEVDDSSIPKKEIFTAIMSKLSNSQLKIRSSRKMLDWGAGSDDGKQKSELTLGLGHHFVKLYGKWILVHRYILPNGVNKVTLQTLFTNKELFDEIKSGAIFKSDDEKVGRFKVRDGHWAFAGKIVRRKLQRLTIDAGVKNYFTRRMDRVFRPNVYFETDGQFASFLIHSPISGMGKTTLITSLAEEYGLPVYSVNINRVDDQTLLDLADMLPEHSLLLLEDIDTNQNLLKKDDSGTLITSDQVTLNGMKEILSEVVPLNNIVLFMTAKDINILDDSLQNVGVIDNVKELLPIPADDVREFIISRYPRININELNDAIVPMSPLDLHALVSVSGISPITLLSNLNNIKDKG